MQLQSAELISRGEDYYDVLTYYPQPSLDEQHDRLWCPPMPNATLVILSASVIIGVVMLLTYLIYTVVISKTVPPVDVLNQHNCLHHSIKL